jgi:hypothetical protein
MTQQEYLSTLQRIHAADSREAIGKLYTELVGYDPFDDEPSLTLAEVKITLQDYVWEDYFQWNDGE